MVGRKKRTDVWADLAGFDDFVLVPLPHDDLAVHVARQRRDHFLVRAERRADEVRRARVRQGLDLGHVVERVDGQERSATPVPGDATVPAGTTDRRLGRQGAFAHGRVALVWGHGEMQHDGDVPSPPGEKLLRTGFRVDHDHLTPHPVQQPVVAFLVRGRRQGKRGQTVVHAGGGPAKGVLERDRGFDVVVHHLFVHQLHRGFLFGQPRRCPHTPPAVRGAFGPTGRAGHHRPAGKPAAGAGGGPQLEGFRVVPVRQVHRRPHHHPTKITRRHDWCGVGLWSR